MTGYLRAPSLSGTASTCAVKFASFHSAQKNNRDKHVRARQWCLIRPQTGNWDLEWCSHNWGLGRHGAAWLSSNHDTDRVKDCTFRDSLSLTGFEVKPLLGIMWRRATIRVTPQLKPHPSAT